MEWKSCEPKITMASFVLFKICLCFSRASLSHPFIPIQAQTQWNTFKSKSFFFSLVFFFKINLLLNCWTLPKIYSRMCVSNKNTQSFSHFDNTKPTWLQPKSALKVQFKRISICTQLQICHPEKYRIEASNLFELLVRIVKITAKKCVALSDFFVFFFKLFISNAIFKA